MKKDILKLFFSKAAFVLYILLFSFVSYRASVGNTVFTYSMVTQMVFIAAEIVVLVVCVAVYHRYSQWFLRYRNILLWLTIAIIFSVQLIISLNTIPNPMYDHGKVFWGAVEYAQHGNSPEFTVYGDYLHHYNGQMALFLILLGLFKAAYAVGITNFFMVAAVTGHILFVVTVYAVFKYLDENIAPQAAVFSLLIIAMFLPFYFQSTVSYTDTYSIWGVPVMLYLYNKAGRENDVKKKVLYSVVAGLAVGVCICVKVTAVIPLIAVVIHKLFNGGKGKGLPLIIVLSLVLIVKLLCNTASDATVLEEYRAGENMPVTHWIMMGLQGDGSYSAHDEWNVTGSVPADQRVAKNIEVIKERLAAMGPTGYMKLLYLKTCRTFGCGTGEMHYNYIYANGELTPSNLVYETVFLNGKFYSVYNNGAQSVYLLMNFMAVIGAVIIFIKKDKLINEYVPYISLIGFWIFMMLWESNHRQLVNQWSLYFITAAIGLYMIYNTVVAKKK